MPSRTRSHASTTTATAATSPNSSTPGSAASTRGTRGGRGRARAARGLMVGPCEPFPPITDAEHAVAHPEPRIHDYGDGGNLHKLVNLEFGDVDDGFAAADLVREDLLFFEGSTHLPMEQHAAVADWSPLPDGKLTLWSSTQTPHYVHRALAQVLELAPAKIRVVATPNGGGFGGKSDPFSHEIVVAKLAMLTGRPVKITLTREEVFYCHRGRHPTLMWVKTGVKKDGAITAMHFKSLLDGGGYGSYGVASTYYTGALQTVTYHVPRYKFQGARAFTNKPPCGPKRGHGTPQPRFALEVHLDKIAEQLGMDPADFRLQHLVSPHSLTANWLRIGSMGLAECIRKVVAGSGWKEKYRKLPPGHGVGLACSSYITGAGLPIYWNAMPHSGVQLKCDRGGGVTVFCGSTEIGQGSDSILPTIVAEGLGLHPPDVALVTRANDLTPVGFGRHSSRVTLMTGNAAIQAAERARDLIDRRLELRRRSSGSRSPVVASSTPRAPSAGSASPRRCSSPRPRQAPWARWVRTHRRPAPGSTGARGSAPHPPTPTARASPSWTWIPPPASCACRGSGSPTTWDARSTPPP